MEKIKIFLPTYQRNSTFIRSVQSLLDQSFVDWSCEVHNDDPKDTFPEKFISSLNDNRFTIINHKQNLGPVATFNLMYSIATTSKYISMLEDDNWWEPEFLKEMYSFMELNPNLSLVWCNMHIWKQDEIGNWISENKLVNNFKDEQIIYKNISIMNCIGALHSNGAMLVRNLNLERFIVPYNIRFDFIEHIRERAFIYPVAYLNKPLANFSITLQTNRKSTISGYHEHEALLIASYFKNIKQDNPSIKEFIKQVKSGFGLSANKLIFAAIVDINSLFLLRFVNLKDWIVFMLYCMKRPMVIWSVIRAKRQNPELWQYLIDRTPKL